MNKKRGQPLKGKVIFNALAKYNEPANLDKVCELIGEKDPVPPIKFLISLVLEAGVKYGYIQQTREYYYVLTEAIQSIWEIERRLEMEEEKLEPEKDAALHNFNLWCKEISSGRKLLEETATRSRSLYPPHSSERICEKSRSMIREKSRSNNCDRCLSAICRTGAVETFPNANRGTLSDGCLNRITDRSRSMVRNRNRRMIRQRKPSKNCVRSRSKIRKNEAIEWIPDKSSCTISDSSSKKIPDTNGSIVRDRNRRMIRKRKPSKNCVRSRSKIRRNEAIEWIPDKSSCTISDRSSKTIPDTNGSMVRDRNRRMIRKRGPSKNCVRSRSKIGRNKAIEAIPDKSSSTISDRSGKTIPDTNGSMVRDKNRRMNRKRKHSKNCAKSRCKIRRNEAAETISDKRPRKISDCSFSTIPGTSVNTIPDTNGSTGGDKNRGMNRKRKPSKNCVRRRSKKIRRNKAIEKIPDKSCSTVSDRSGNTIPDTNVSRVKDENRRMNRKRKHSKSCDRSRCKIRRNETGETMSGKPSRKRTDCTIPNTSGNPVREKSGSIANTSGSTIRNGNSSNYFNRALKTIADLPSLRCFKNANGSWLSHSSPTKTDNNSSNVKQVTRPKRVIKSRKVRKLKKKTVPCWKYVKRGNNFQIKKYKKQQKENKKMKSAAKETKPKGCKIKKQKKSEIRKCEPAPAVSVWRMY